MRFIDFLERLLLRRKEESSQPLRIINNPVGVVVAKTIEPYDIDHMYDDPDKMPGLCPVCHYTIEKIPNLDYHTATTKDIAMTYDGFFIVRDRFKRFCDEQGYENLTFIPLNNSSKHYYFMPNDIFPIDVKAYCILFMQYDIFLDIFLNILFFFDIFIINIFNLFIFH